MAEAFWYTVAVMLGIWLAWTLAALTVMFDEDRRGGGAQEP